MTTDDFYSALLHPDGRAKGGEPCVKCGAAIPAGVHFTLRDRHVCSHRCNFNLKRQFRRAVESDKVELQAAELVEPKVYRTKPRPYVFRELADAPPGEVPVEYDGFGPLDGDVVERFGRRVLCRVLEPENPGEEGRFVSIDLDSGCAQIWGLEHGSVDQCAYESEHVNKGNGYKQAGMFVHKGQRNWWNLEFVRCVDPDGVLYNWRAPVVLNEEQLGARAVTLTYWSPDYQSRSAGLRKATQTRGRITRSQRLDDAFVEAVDPAVIYTRDGWICGICGLAINPDLRWPDPMAVSLDHVVALANGGHHSAANLQAAHLVCNQQKGAR